MTHADDELIGHAARFLRERGRTHEASLVETALRRGQPQRVRGLVRELGAGAGAAAMQQSPSQGTPPAAPASFVTGDPLAAQAFQREEPDPAA